MTIQARSAYLQAFGMIEDHHSRAASCLTCRRHATCRARPSLSHRSSHIVCTCTISSQVSN